MLVGGKVAVVSGVGPGMGRDISLVLARHGADV
ncbi:MAG: short-chain dehydrogenase, partial [Acidimicrobiia bacterium]